MWKPVANATKATAIRVSLTLDEALYDQFAERATKRGKTVEQEIVERLSTCVGWTATQPVYLDDDQRNALSAIAGRSLRSPADLLDWAQNISTLTVEGTQIPLSERLLKRLMPRHFDKTLTRSEFMTKLVTERLEEYVGMR